MTDDEQLRVTPTATHWGSYWAETRGGKLVGLRDYADDPDPAEIGPGLLDMVEHPTRIRRPAIRKSWLEDRAGSDRADNDRARRGAEPFVAVPWDEALDIAAEEIDRVRRTHGPQAIYGGSYGWASAGRFHHAVGQLHRLLNCAGGYTASVGAYSFATAEALLPHIVGPFRSLTLDRATAWPVIADRSELIVAFGGLALKNAQVTSGGVGRHTTRQMIARARARGAEFVSVSPLRSDAPDGAEAEWIAPRPNSDAALMLGLAHTLVDEELHDRAFLARCCVGYERFEPYLLGAADGRPKDADWAAAICGVDAATIRALARRMAAKRTMIALAWSLQRSEHGEQPYWMGVVLAAMLGQIGLPGGGFGLGYGSENGIGNAVRLFRFPALPQGENPVKAPIPVARIADALLDPGAEYAFNGERRRYPDLRLIYWAGGNPFHHHQDLNRLVAALRRPETIIVNEIWWTPMARHADIVFPVATTLEREDIAMTHWEPLIVAMRKAIEPVGEARTDYAVLSGLARRLGCEAAFTEGRSEEDWIRHLWDQARQRAAEEGFTLPSLDALREQETATLPDPIAEQVMLAEFRADPDAAPLTTPSGRIEIFSETIASFGYDDCPGHPVWLEPLEWLGAAKARDYPLHLMSNQPPARLHSQFDPGRPSQARKIAGREPIAMHRRDAAARGLSAGDVVEVFNDRGACLAGLEIRDDLLPGVVRLATGAWYDPDRPGEIGARCNHGSVNVLTRDVGTSRLGQGPSAHSALVEVRRFDGEPPPVRVHQPPEIVGRGAG